MVIRTKAKPRFYVQALRGVCFVTWVSEEDRGEALQIKDDKADDWKRLIEDWQGIELEVVSEHLISE